MTKRFGFTLAEVLVTLTIIGVVASMTVPSLMTNTNTQEMTAGYKKAMSTLNQAVTMQYALEGTDMRNFDPAKTAVADAVGDNADDRSLGWMLRQRLNVVRHVDNIANVRNAAWGGNDSIAANTTAMYLADGTVILFPADLTKSTYCKDDEISPDNQENARTFSGEGADATSAQNAECLYSVIVDVNGDRGRCDWRDENNGVRQNGQLNPGDCFIVDVYPDGVRPGDWMGTRLLYGSQRNDVNAAGGGEE